MYMGQNYGKQAKITPESSARESHRPAPPPSSSSAATGITLSDAPGANESQTGNLVITIRMLTMNSNELNTATAAATDNSSNDGANGSQFSQNQLEPPSNHLEPSSSGCTVCSCIPVSTNGSSSLADKISHILSSKCKIGNTSSSSNNHQCNNIASTSCAAGLHAPLTKVKVKKSNWSLGKFTGRSKRDKKKELLAEDNVQPTSSSGVGKVKKRNFLKFCVCS